MEEKVLNGNGSAIESKAGNNEDVNGDNTKNETGSYISEIIQVLKHIDVLHTPISATSIEESKEINSTKQTGGILETIKSRKPSQKLSEIALKNSKSPDPFRTTLTDDPEILKLIKKSNLSNSLDNIEKKKNNPQRCKAYKNFLTTLFESILIMKKIEPVEEVDLAIRIISIPRPLELSCLFL